MLYKFYGPPGTGKTHRLISRAKAYARIGTPLHKIGYFAFTRKAAKEAKERMPVEDKKLDYFQTLHSFCFNYLGLKEEQVMQPYHYEDLGKKLGIKVKYVDKYNKEEIHYLTCDNPYFQMIGRAINRDIDIRKEFDRNEHNPKEIKWTTLKHIHHNFEIYKDKHKIYDCLKSVSEDIYLAGDDDQAIFAWAGADVKRFIKEPAKEKVLKFSKRISKAVQEQSEICVERILGMRKDKKYFARNFTGKAELINNLNQINLKKGKWLILARTISRLMKIDKELRKKNLYFESNKGKSYRVRLYKAAIAYTDWTMGKLLEEKELKDVTEFIPHKKWDVQKPWYDSFTQADVKEKDYIRGLLENNEKLNEPARIWISTIHAIKGGEEDNVILCLDMGDKINKAIKRSQDKMDEEHRVWYVGTTRARNNLYKLKAKIKRKGYQL